MANNRMELKNTRTGNKFMLAKYYPSTGWYPVFEVKELERWMNDQCFGHIDDEARSAANAHHYSLGGMWGADYELVLEVKSND